MVPWLPDREFQISREDVWVWALETFENSERTKPCIIQARVPDKSMKYEYSEIYAVESVVYWQNYFLTVKFKNCQSRVMGGASAARAPIAWRYYTWPPQYEWKYYDRSRINHVCLLINTLSSTQQPVRSVRMRKGFHFRMARSQCL